MKQLRAFLNRYFHACNIIIVSQHQVKHVPVSVVRQLAFLFVLIGIVAWASYSTGSYMAARHVVQEQSQVLHSVANTRIETNFRPIFQTSRLLEESQETKLPSLSDPMYTVSALDDHKLNLYVASLENKLATLEAENKAIIERVRTKTAQHIDNLEFLIKQTGLTPDDLKKEAGNGKGKTKKAEGGPYIPNRVLGFSPAENQLYGELDELALLRKIIGNLPLGQPIRGEMQSGFGQRVDPFNGHLAFHSGVDIAGGSNAKILCAADGKVIFAGRNGAYGNMVDVEHGLGLVTRYGHLSHILVEEGQAVLKGDPIGVQGSTGRSTGQHLHYEVRYKDKPMNPKTFLTVGQHVPKN